MKLKLSLVAAAIVLAACNKAPETSSSSDTASKTTSEQTEVAQTPKKELASGVYKDNMDTSIKPGDDFFYYVNGTWLNDIEIPADKGRYGAFDILADEAQEDVMEIIRSSSEGDFKSGSDEQKVGDLYRSYMNMDKRNELGIAPLHSEFALIDAISNKDQLAEYFARANKYGFGTPFALSQYVDFKNPNAYMTLTWQGGLGLPDREYYLKTDEASQKLRSQYQAHIAKMLDLAGVGNGSKNAEMLVQLETELAKHHITKEQSRDMVALYNKVKRDELSDLMPNFNWDKFLTAAQMPTLDTLVVTQPNYMTALDGIIQNTKLDDWKVFLKWHLVNSTAGRLSEELDKASFEFYGKTLNGTPEQRPQWRRAVGLVNGNLGEVIGKVYVKRHFKPEAKKRMMVMIENLLKAYELSIKELDWMTDETKKQALDKLSKFNPKIGYPDKWKDYSDLTIKRDDLFGNLMRSSEIQYQQMLDKQGKPVDKTEWAMTPQTVNAYYNPPMNEIVFPAAILQPPFFNMEADDAVNYGGIGAVIGHEIGHGFDDSGSTFDGDGVLRNWWTIKDRNEFKKRTSKLIEQYDGFVALPNLHVNGTFTLGENIGDLGGISIALRAYHLSLDGKEAPVIDGFTGDQRVFIGFGQVWAGKIRDEALRTRIQTDPHSPAIFRANGSVRNVPEWYEAFDIKPGDKLYLAPEDRVKIW